MKKETFMKRVENLSKEFKLPYETEEYRNRVMCIFRGKNANMQCWFWGEDENGIALLITNNESETLCGTRKWKTIRRLFMEYEYGIVNWS